MCLYKVTMTTSNTLHSDPFKHWIEENTDEVRCPVHEDLHDEGMRCRLVRGTTFGSTAASAAGVAEVYDGSGSVAATAADVADLSDFEALDAERSIVSSYPMGIKSKLLN